MERDELGKKKRIVTWKSLLSEKGTIIILFNYFMEYYNKKFLEISS